MTNEKINHSLSHSNSQITTIPGDKSISHRSIILGSLAGNNSTFKHFLCAEDCLNTATIFQQLGVPIQLDILKKTVHIKGVGLHGLQAARGPLDVGNSGTGIRLITGLLAAQGFESQISGDHSIQTRPMKRIIDPLTEMGAKITGNATKNDIVPPLTISGCKKISPIHYPLPVASAQVKTAILLASLYSEDLTTIIEPAPCRNHSELMLKAFGADIQVHGREITCSGKKALQNPFDEPLVIPADFSSAAFFIVLALIHPKLTLKITNVGLNPTRATLIKVLEKMGGKITIENEKNTLEPYGDIIVTSSSLTNITIDPKDIPFIIDEIPILAVAALFAKGTLTVTKAKELRYKESDRIKKVVEIAQQFGGQIEEQEDGFTMKGGLNPIKTPVITTNFDHRIAMSAIIASVASNTPIELDNINCINTSFPNFFKILTSL